MWLSVITDLQTRGVQDIFIACMDGLSGFKEAVLAVFPHAQIQRCIIHQIRNSLKYITWTDRKAFMLNLKEVYQAATRESAEAHLCQLGEKWGDKYAVAIRSSRRTHRTCGGCRCRDDVGKQLGRSVDLLRLSR
jgi:putative transposase